MQRRSLASLRYYKRWSSLLLLLLKYFAFPPSFHLIVSVLIVTPVLAKLVFLCDPKGLPWMWFLRPGTPGSMRVTVPVSSPAIVGAAHLLLPSCGAAAPPGQLCPLPRWRQMCKNMPLAKKWGGLDSDHGLIIHRVERCARKMACTSSFPNGSSRESGPGSAALELG